MPPDDLRDLAAKATPGPWEPQAASVVFVPAHAVVAETLTPRRYEDARLIALAPELAVLCADMADALAKTIYGPPGWSGPDVWWADETRALLARLERLT